MRQVAALAAATILLISMCRLIRPVSAQPVSCGSARADVGTLTDASVGNIDKNQIISANISTLAAFPPPDPLPATSRFDPYETTIYTVTGSLVQASLQASGDIDVEIQDPSTGDVMTVALPDTAQCAASAAPEFLQLMEAARSAFIQAYGMPSLGTPMPLSGMASVVGVGFLDPVLGQTGEASNGMELHPVLEFEPGGLPGAGLPSDAGAATATPAAGATPAPTAAATSAAATPHQFYVDTNSSQPVIFCDTDPALTAAIQRNLVAFPTLAQALVASPGYQLNQAC